MEIIKQNELDKKALVRKYKQVKDRIIKNIDTNIKDILPYYVDNKLDTKEFKQKNEAKVRCFYPDVEEGETIYKLRNATSIVLYLKDDKVAPEDIKKTLNAIKEKVKADDKDFEKAIYDFISYRDTKNEETQRQKAEAQG